MLIISPNNGFILCVPCYQGYRVVIKIDPDIIIKLSASNQEKEFTPSSNLNEHQKEKKIYDHKLT